MSEAAAAGGTRGPSCTAGPRAGKAPQHGWSCWQSSAQLDSCPSRPRPAGQGSGQGPWPGAGPGARLPFKGNLVPALSPPHLALPLLVGAAPGAARGHTASVGASTGCSPSGLPRTRPSNEEALGSSRTLGRVLWTTAGRPQLPSSLTGSVSYQQPLKKLFEAEISKTLTVSSSSSTRFRQSISSGAVPQQPRWPVT